MEKKMDEMKIKLRTNFMKNIVKNIINKAIKNKLGYDIGIDINDIVAIHKDGKVRIRADIEAELTDSDLKKIIKE